MNTTAVPSYTAITYRVSTIADILNDRAMLLLRALTEWRSQNLTFLSRAVHRPDRTAYTDCTEYHIHQQIYIHRPNFVAQAKLFLCCLDYGEMEVHPHTCSTPPPNISCRKLVLCSGLFFPGGRTPFIPRASTAPKNRDVLSSLRIEPRFISVRGWRKRHAVHDVP